MFRKIVLLSFLILMIFSCREAYRDVDVSGIDIHIEIKRFEKDLFETDPSHVEDMIPFLIKKYDRFFKIFNHRIIRIGSYDDPFYPEYLRKFITDYVNVQIYERTLEIFPNLDFLKTELENAFKHYKYYFPERQIPEIITYISGINQSVVSDSGMLAVGLDDYLGTDELLYKQMGLYNYLTKGMYKARIVFDCMRLWAMTEFPFNDSINNLVSNMIYEGSVMYFVNTMVPVECDTLKWGFTNNEMNFCRNSEKQMWAYRIENKMLFNSDKFTLDKFIREGPFTKDFSTESPARAVVWIGYNIVNSYMDHHKDLILRDLMKERDYQKILNTSFYSP
jgi:hypothetical protein